VPASIPSPILTSVFHVFNFPFYLKGRAELVPRSAYRGEKTSTGVDARLGEWKRPEAIQMLKNCAQSVPKNIENYRNPEGLENGWFLGKTLYFLHFSFFRCFLHTVGVRGSFKISCHSCLRFFGRRCDCQSCHPCLRFIGRRRDCQLSSLAILTSGLGGISCRNGLKSIVSGAEGVLGNMRSCHRLACCMRSKTSRVIFFRFAGGRMSCERSLAYIGHLKHACANPCSACFYGFAESVVLQVCLLKNWKYSFGAIRGPDGKQSLILYVVFFHK